MWGTLFGPSPRQTTRCLVCPAAMLSVRLRVRKTTRGQAGSLSDAGSWCERWKWEIESQGTPDGRGREERAISQLVGSLTGNQEDVVRCGDQEMWRHSGGSAWRSR